MGKKFVPETALVQAPRPEVSKFSFVSIEGPPAKAITYAFAVMLVIIEMVVLWRVFH